jgi:hypothetical protein
VLVGVSDGVAVSSDDVVELGDVGFEAAFVDVDVLPTASAVAVVARATAVRATAVTNTQRFGPAAPRAGEGSASKSSDVPDTPDASYASKAPRASAESSPGPGP